MPRLRKSRPDAIKQLCAKKGWGANELAEWAEISITTVYKAFNGEPMFRCKLADIARALNVPIAQVLDPDDPEAEPVPIAQSRKPKKKPVLIRFTVTVEVDADSLADEELSNNIKLFAESIKRDPNFEPTQIRYGSVFVTFETPQHELELAIHWFARRAYERLHYTAITIHDYDRTYYTQHFPAIVAVLELYESEHKLECNFADEGDLVITLPGNTPAHEERIVQIAPESWMWTGPQPFSTFSFAEAL